MAILGGAVAGVLIAKLIKKRQLKNLEKKIEENAEIN